MSDYQSDDEQLEAIKRWFRENGRTAFAAVAIAAVAVFGFLNWQQRQGQQQEASALQYQSLLEASRQLDQQSTPDMLATAQHLADGLINDYPKTTYAQFAALFKAKIAVQAADLAAAQTQLQWVLDHNPSPEISALAQLRLARVLVAKDDAKGALALLDESHAGSYAFAYAELKGDISLAAGDSAAARTAYERAQDLEHKLQNPVNDPLLEFKLHDLPAGSAAASSPPTAKHES